MISINRFCLLITVLNAFSGQVLTDVGCCHEWNLRIGKKFGEIKDCAFCARKTDGNPETMLKGAYKVGELAQEILSMLPSPQPSREYVQDFGRPTLGDTSIARFAPKAGLLIDVVCKLPNITQQLTKPFFPLKQDFPVAENQTPFWMPNIYTD